MKKSDRIFATKLIGLSVIAVAISALFMYSSKGGIPATLKADVSQSEGGQCFFDVCGSKRDKGCLGGPAGPVAVSCSDSRCNVGPCVPSIPKNSPELSLSTPSPSKVPTPAYSNSPTITQPTATPRIPRFTPPAPLPLEKPAPASLVGDASEQEEIDIQPNQLPSPPWWQRFFSFLKALF